MAISTYKVFLMHKGASESAYTKLIDIKEFPDLGGDPEMLETTTLSDKMQTYIAGIQSLDGLSFTANYDLANFKALKALEGKDEKYAVWFSFDGQLTAYPTGGGVNEVVDIGITIAPSTPIQLEEE